MNQHDHHHGHDEHGHEHKHHQQSKGLHKDWRTWVVVLLMLAAMGMYVMTLDEADPPGGPPGAEVPAAAE